VAKVKAALAKAGISAGDLDLDDSVSLWVNGKGQSCGTPSHSSLGGVDPVRIAGGARW
jgi:hypothetical protein